MRALVSRLIVSVLAVCCFGVAPAHAFFHLMQIEKIVGGVEGDVTAQAVQLRLRAALMGDVQNARLVAYDENGANPIIVCDMDAPVPNQQPNKRILICTPSFITKTNPNAVPDFAMTANIPASYLAAGSLAYESDSGFVQWRVCWGGKDYTGPFNMNRANAPDGSCAPAFPSGLPFETAQALCFPGLCTDPGTSSAEDYIISTEPAVMTDHEGNDYPIIETPRACCAPSGGCEELTYTQCIALKGEPGPPGSNCSTVKCSSGPGSCCFENGDCLTLPRADCLVLGGIPGPEGSDCCDNPCRRSCCFPNGSCQDLPIDDCFKSGGQPGEFGSTCFDASCPIFTIACCLPNGSCFEVTLINQCLDAGGTPQGFGTTCSTVTCTPAMLGCCLPGGTCENMTEADCLTMGGLPGSIPCTSAVCDVACCTPTGCLRVIFAGDCFDRYGGFQGDIGVPCETAGCFTLGFGACCQPNGDCTNTNLAGCVALGGFYAPFGNCETFNCPQPQACCFSDGTCQLLQPAQCLQQGGTTQAGVFDCFIIGRGISVCPQPRACCLPTGQCEEILPDLCVAQGGEVLGPEFFCGSSGRGSTQAQCSTVACCFADGSCEDLTIAGCIFFGGSPDSSGTTCAGSTCLQPVSCCFPDGSCAELAPIFCTNAGGTPGEPGSSCDPNPCFQPTGACCRPDGSCFNDATLAECNAVGGDWHGQFSFCDTDRSGTPVVCPQPRVACCLPNGQCSDVTIDDCVNILGGIPGPFGSECCSTACSLENHPCCFPDNVCMPMTPSDCVQAGGKPALTVPAEECGLYECPPENDDCADALPITNGVTFFDNYNATDDGPREPEACGDDAPVRSKPRGGGCPGGFRTLGSDIWFCYTATCDGIVRVALCGSDFDTAVAVYEGCVCPKGASAIACNDDSEECFDFDPKDPKKPVARGGDTSLQSFLTFEATKGQQYLIRVGGYDCEQGSGRIEIDCQPGPDNDDCSNAIPLSENGTYFFCNLNATNDGPLEPMACGDDKPIVNKPVRGGGCADGIFRVLGSDIWYCYTASCTGNVSIALCGSDYDTSIAIYNGCVCPTEASAIACNDDDDFCAQQMPRGASLQSYIRFPVTQGQQYLIRIGGYDCEQGCGQFELICTPGPSNDECEFPIGIGDGIVAFDTTGATTDGPNEDACSKGKTSEISNDIWFIYTASCTGTATASLCNIQTEFDTKIAAYDGTNCPTEPNTAIICNDQACQSDQSEISFPVVAGQQYLIRVGGFFGDTGPGVLTMSCVPGDGTEACCFGDGSCQQLLPSLCEKQGGTSQGPGTACVVRGNAVVCPQPVNCCFQTGTCIPLVALECTELGGTVIPDCFVCGCLAADVDQSGEVGLSDTAFLLIRWDTQGVPAFFPGDINGDGSIGLADMAVIILNWQKTCPQKPLPRACCFPDNSCQELTLTDCVAQGGIPLQPESTCAIADCALIPRTGACCFEDGSCMDLSTDDCSIAGGQTRGIGTSCATTMCPQPKP